MSNASTNLVLRNDTILGVCEAIGQDFGFHANWLRVALASSFYFAPYAVIGLYLGLGVVVALTRWFAPDQLPPEIRHLLARLDQVEAQQAAAERTATDKSDNDAAV